MHHECIMNESCSYNIRCLNENYSDRSLNTKTQQITITTAILCFQKMYYQCQCVVNFPTGGIQLSVKCLPQGRLCLVNFQGSPKQLIGALAQMKSSKRQGKLYSEFPREFLTPRAVQSDKSPHHIPWGPLGFHLIDPLL